MKRSILSITTALCLTSAAYADGWQHVDYGVSGTGNSVGVETHGCAQITARITGSDIVGSHLSRGGCNAHVVDSAGAAHRFDIETVNGGGVGLVQRGIGNSADLTATNGGRIGVFQNGGGHVRAVVHGASSLVVDQY